MIRYLPIVIAVLAIGAVTVFNGSITDRWTGGINAKAEYCAEYLDAVPMNIGEWEGTDQEVGAREAMVAGAVGHVRRSYRRRGTDDIVNVWLIVGHSAVIIGHTPDICYKAQGFHGTQKIDQYPLDVEGEAPANFWTSVFARREGARQSMLRVFWAWHLPKESGPVGWQAPGDRVKDARYEYASSKALYKLYFTTLAGSPEEAPEESLANEFSKVFLPVVNKILVGSGGDGPPPPPIEKPAGEETAFDAGSVQGLRIRC